MTVGRRHIPSRSLWLWTGYWVVLFAATHLRIPQGVPTGFRHSDKLVHFVAYFVLARLGASALLARGRLSMAALVGWGMVYLSYGAADEWLQQFTGREASVADWLADAVGVLAATLPLWLRVRRSQISEPDARVAGGNKGPNVTRD